MYIELLKRDELSRDSKEIVREIEIRQRQRERETVPHILGKKMTGYS